MKLPKHLAAALFAAAFLISAGPASAAEKLTVLLDWFVNPDHAPLIIAKEKGFFKNHGLDVELVAPADPNLPPKLVAAGKADLAVSYQPQLHVQVAYRWYASALWFRHRLTRWWFWRPVRSSPSPI
jgi:putative hydroxymethylpyrimidine transport system substrate-binding protein